MEESSVVLLQEMIEEAFFNLLDIEGIAELTETKELLDKTLNMIDGIVGEIQAISEHIENENNIGCIKETIKEDIEKITGKEVKCNE